MSNAVDRIRASNVLLTILNGIHLHERHVNKRVECLITTVQYRDYIASLKVIASGIPLKELDINTFSGIPVRCYHTSAGAIFAAEIEHMSGGVPCLIMTAEMLLEV